MRKINFTRVFYIAISLLFHELLALIRSTVPDGADACEKIFEVAKCVQGTVPEVNRFIILNQ